MKTFFDEENRLERLTEMGDVLVKLSASVNWEQFRPTLEDIYYTEDNRAGGRKAFDKVMMFKILILQQLYNVSDDSIEYQINDRLSFQRFLGLDIGEKVPDAKTIWLFRERLKNSKREKELFNLYTEELKRRKIITKSGSIIDATFIERPEQKANDRRRTDNRYKKAEVKNENPNKERQYDKEARFTKKHNKWYFGYKDHIKADKDSKLIVDYAVTDAITHDNTQVEELLDKEDNVVFMDAGYRSKEQEAVWKRKCPNIEIHISKAGFPGKPLTYEEKIADSPNRKIRCRVEHIFGHMEKSMGGKFVRCVGLARTQVSVMLKNLAYNISRASLLLRLST
jgi:IS5 family transposase